MGAFPKFIGRQISDVDRAEYRVCSRLRSRRAAMPDGSDAPSPLN